MSHDTCPAIYLLPSAKVKIGANFFVFLVVEAEASKKGGKRGRDAKRAIIPCCTSATEYDYRCLFTVSCTGPCMPL